MTKLDIFADMLAHHDLSTGDRGGDIALAAEIAGETEAWGRAMFARMCRRLGEPESAD